jgi:hypothetical protein
LLKTLLLDKQLLPKRRANRPSNAEDQEREAPISFAGFAYPAPEKLDGAES